MHFGLSKAWAAQTSRHSKSSVTEVDLYAIVDVYLDDQLT